MLRMQEVAFPGFKFQSFSGEYAPTHVAFGHCYPPLISNDKLRLILFLLFVLLFLLLFQTQVQLA